MFRRPTPGEPIAVVQELRDQQKRAVQGPERAFVLRLRAKAYFCVLCAVISRAALSEPESGGCYLATSLVRQQSRLTFLRRSFPNAAFYDLWYRFWDGRQVQEEFRQTYDIGELRR